MEKIDAIYVNENFNQYENCFENQKMFETIINFQTDKLFFSANGIQRGYLQSIKKVGGKEPILLYFPLNENEIISILKLRCKNATNKEKKIIGLFFTIFSNLIYKTDEIKNLLK